MYEEIQFVMATQGYKMDNAKTSRTQAEVFHTTRNGITAFGIYSGDKFEVLEESQIDFTKLAHHEKYNKLRKDLLKSGDILNIDGNFILKKTLEFNTPSGAGQFILGGSINGWVEWKDKEDKLWTKYIELLRSKVCQRWNGLEKIK